MNCTSHQILFDDQMEKNEMSRACSMCEGEESGLYGFGGETWMKETTLKTQT